MRLGLFSVVDHYPPELSRTTADLYGELLEHAGAWGQPPAVRPPLTAARDLG